MLVGVFVVGGIVLTVVGARIGPGLTTGATAMTAVVVALRASNDQERQHRQHERELAAQTARHDLDLRRREDAPAYQIIATVKRVQLHPRNAGTRYFVVEVRNCSAEAMHDVHASLAVVGQGVLTGIAGWSALVVVDDGSGVPATYSGRLPHLAPGGVQNFRFDFADNQGINIPTGVITAEHDVRAVTTFFDARQRQWGVVDSDVWAGEIPPPHLWWARKPMGSDENQASS